MSFYKGIAKLNPTDHKALLKMCEQLASIHKEYRRLVGDVASAPTQDAEIDTLLAWRYILTHDVIHHVIDERTGELARYDHDTKTNKDFIGYKKYEEPTGLRTTEYAGSLDEEGAPQQMNPSAYATTLHDLYMEVIQLAAYTHYNIKRMYHDPTTVIPISACDDYTETDEDTERPSTWEIDRQTYKDWYARETERNA